MAQCYYPNGENFPATTTFNRAKVCNADTPFSACCVSFEHCMSNGLCRNNNGTALLYTREGCTDPTWQDDACPKVCIYTDYLLSVSWPVLEGTSGAPQCATDSGGEKGNGTDLAIDFPGTDLSTSGASVIPSIRSSSTSSQRTSASISSPQQTESSSSSSTSSSSQTTDSSSPSNTALPLSSSSKTPLIIGTSVGISLGLIAIAIFVIFFRRYRRLQAQLSEAQAQREAAQVANKPQYIAPPMQEVDGYGQQRARELDGNQPAELYAERWH